MRAAILTKYHFASLWNWRTSYLGRFIEPIAYLLFLSASLQSSLSDQVDQYGTFVLAGLACLLSFRAATASMSDVANDRKWGVFAMYVLQGGSAKGYLLSILMFTSAVYLLQFLLLAACAYIVLPGVMPSAPSILMIAGNGLLFVFGWSALGAAVGGRVDSYATRDLLVTVTTLPVILAAPIFVPLDGSWVRYVAAINPLTYQVQMMRNPSWFALLAAILWACVASIVAVSILKSADRVSRER